MRRDIARKKYHQHNAFFKLPFHITRKSTKILQGKVQKLTLLKEKILLVKSFKASFELSFIQPTETHLYAILNNFFGVLHLYSPGSKLQNAIREC